VLPAWTAQTNTRVHFGRECSVCIAAYLKVDFLAAKRSKQTGAAYESHPHALPYFANSVDYAQTLRCKGEIDNRKGQ
jgi:hypothetical protein